MTLKIGQSVWEQIRRHGEETYPNECCGVLLGQVVDDRIKSVEATVRCDNQRSDSLHNRYAIDPRDVVHIQREARERMQEVIGFYHSHPDHPARWSATDLAEAHWIGSSYVITSVINGVATDTNSFTLGGDYDTKYFEDEGIEVG